LTGRRAGGHSIALKQEALLKYGIDQPRPADAMDFS